MKENPPQKIVFERLSRDMNAKPRVTRFQIKWSVLGFRCLAKAYSSHYTRDLSPPPQGGSAAAGAAASAAVPSADDLDGPEEEADKHPPSKANGIS